MLLPMNRTKATSFDIAFRAGVSQATVSRALRNSPLVSAETRRRVQEVARELNYKVDKAASSLRSQQAYTLALLLFEDPSPGDSLINPFFLSMLGSITRAAAHMGFDLLVSFQQLSEDWHADYQDSHKADGLILLGYGDYRETCHRLARLVERGTPFVRWGPILDDPTAGVAIGSDNVEGGRLATAHLLATGRRRLAFLGAAGEGSPEFRDRHVGYLRALREAGLNADPALHVDVMDSTEEAGYIAAKMLLARGADFDGLFAASDLIAIGAMRALADAGRPAGDAVGVVGFDDQPVAAVCTPTLSTVNQNTRLAGERLVSSLIARIRGESIQNELLVPQLVVRQSSGRPRTDAGPPQP